MTIISAQNIGTFSILLSNTQTTPRTAAQVRASGVALPGTTTNCIFTGLDRAPFYYGWVVAARGDYESVVMLITPAQITMIPVPIIPSNFAISLATMAQGHLGGAAPYTGLISLPSPLVGVHMTKGINHNAYACAFDRGPIHAYGIRTNPWNNYESNTELIYSGLNSVGT